jgi:nucleoporin POM34
MAAQTTPSTPGSQSAPPAAPTPPTGTWRHPRLEEIIRRQQESTFGEKNLRKVLYSSFALVLSFYLPRYIPLGFVYVGLKLCYDIR